MGITKSGRSKNKTKCETIQNYKLARYSCTHKYPRKENVFLGKPFAKFNARFPLILFLINGDVQLSHRLILIFSYMRMQNIFKPLLNICFMLYYIEDFG